MRFDRAFQILDLHGGPWFAFFAALARDAGQDSAQRDFGILAQPFQVSGGVRGELLHFVDVLVQRMSGDVESERFFLAGEFFLAGPILHLGQRDARTPAVLRSARRTVRIVRFRDPSCARAPVSMALSITAMQLRARAFQRVDGAGL